MRDYSITKENNNTWYHAKVTDNYGNKYDNYFEYAHEANDWIYHIWETENHRNEWRENSKDLLANAIANCIELDKKAGREPSLD